jgi:hypothetical protein
MTASLTPAAERFRHECDATLDWLGATEALWMTAPPTSAVRTRLKTPQMEALYEAAFLRLFTAWEVAVEEVTLRMMARAAPPSWVPIAPAGKVLYSSLKSARLALYGGADYLLWHNPATVAKRIASHLAGSPLEAEIRAQATWLEQVAQVRHRIAHASDDAARKFDVAALALTGTAHRGSPGRLLRSQDIADPLNPTRWIVRLDSGLRSIIVRGCA